MVSRRRHSITVEASSAGRAVLRSDCLSRGPLAAGSERRFAAAVSRANAILGLALPGAGAGPRPRGLATPISSGASAAR